jgi:DNA-binding NtrC family response regulator
MKKAGILLIDDEPSIVEALAMILDDQGYETISASCGRDGINHASQRSFDITITDLRLPDMSGLDVLNAIRERNGDTCVIVITAHSTPEMVCELKASGAIDVLKKPFMPSDLLDLIRSILQERERQSVT